MSALIGWEATASETAQTGADWNLTVYAICADAELEPPAPPVPGPLSLED